jgi:hypothetical protein
VGAKLLFLKLRFCLITILLLLPAVRNICSGPRLGCAREYGSVFDDQKIVSDHEKCAIFVIAPLFYDLYGYPTHPLIGGCVGVTAGMTGPSVRHPIASYIIYAISPTYPT